MSEPTRPAVEITEDLPMGMFLVKIEANPRKSILFRFQDIEAGVPAAGQELAYAWCENRFTRWAPHARPARPSMLPTNLTAATHIFIASRNADSDARLFIGSGLKSLTSLPSTSQTSTVRPLIPSNAI